MLFRVIEENGIREEFRYRILLQGLAFLISKVSAEQKGMVESERCGGRKREMQETRNSRLIFLMNMLVNFVCFICSFVATDGWDFLVCNTESGCRNWKETQRNKIFSVVSCHDSS